MKSLLKKLLAIMIILTIILAIPTTYVYADTHTCSFEKIRITYCYAQDNDTHVTETYFKYDCWCGNYYEGPTAITGSAHSFGADHYSGNHYHSGAYHYYQYEKSCSPCGLDVPTKWTRVICNGVCQTPW